MVEAYSCDYFDFFDEFLKFMQDQNHPLYSNDRGIIDRLLAKELPSSSDLIELARLFIRYQEFPGANDIKTDLSKLLNFWGISREELNSKVREIWANGYRPGDHKDEVVGSGFDTTENENT